MSQTSDNNKIDAKSTSAFKIWKDHYYQSPVFFASLSLCLLYLTVLSTGVQYQTYMLSLQFSPLSVSLIRFAAVCVELSATCFAPSLIQHIGQIRAGLWSINWQVLWLTAGVGLFIWFERTTYLASYVLTGAIIFSRLGLWGFDLAIQDLVQEVMLDIKLPVSMLNYYCSERLSLNEVSFRPARWVFRTCLSYFHLLQR